MPNSLVDVAAGAPNPMKLRDNGDDTVSDPVTGLMWQRTVPVTTYAPPDATRHCAALRAGGHDDWRVPSAIELVSIVDPSRGTPALDPAVFPDTPSTLFLTTTTAGSTTAVWLVDFSDGTLDGDANFPSSPRNVRCVR